MYESNMGAIIIGILLGGLIGGLIGSPVSAIFLRVASKWVAKLKISFGKAYWIVFSSFVINFIIGFIFFGIFGLLASSKGSIGPVEILFLLLPVGFLIQSLIIYSQLNVSFGKACLVNITMVGIAIGITFCFGLAIFALSTSKISFPHVVQQAVAHDTQQETISVNAPTYFPDAIWLMSKSQVKALFPDAFGFGQDDLKLDSTSFTRPAFIDFIFRDNQLVKIIITFKGETNERIFRLTHLLVTSEYGAFPEPTRTNEYNLTSKKHVGIISVEHTMWMYKQLGISLEQIILSPSKMP